MSEDASQRLDELKLLWESDPSSKVYLQLASVYRQQGKLDKAIEVLETSLQHRPRDPRGRVALARCRMEQKDDAAAAELLEEVIRQDAAHLEANKQLLECYLRLGDAAKAEERLNIYKLLNDRDPELDHLEYRLSSLQQGDGEEPEPDPEFQLEPESEPEAELESAPEAETESETEPETEAEPEREPQPPSESPPALAAETGGPATAPERAEPSDSRPAASTSDEDSGSEVVPDAPPPPPAPPSPPPVVAAESGEAPSPSASSPADPLASATGPGDSDDLFDLSPAPAPADDDPWAGDLFDLAPPQEVEAVEASPDLGGLWEQTEVVELEADEEGEAEEEADSVAGGEPEVAGGEPEPPTEAPVPVEAAPVAGSVEKVPSDEEDEEDEEPEAATATLGLLYLKQGHLDEAETIFRRVLARDADHEAALAGLQQLETLRLAEAGAAEAESPSEAEPVDESPPVVEPEVDAAAPAEEATDEAEGEAEAADVADVTEAADAPPAALTAQALLGRVAMTGEMPSDAKGRKIAVLTQYIQQIRTASGNHVH